MGVPSPIRIHVDTNAEKDLNGLRAEQVDQLLIMKGKTLTWSESFVKKSSWKSNMRLLTTLNLK